MLLPFRLFGKYSSSNHLKPQQPVTKDDIHVVAKMITGSYDHRFMREAYEMSQDTGSQTRAWRLSILNKHDLETSEVLHSVFTRVKIRARPRKTSMLTSWEPMSNWTRIGLAFCQIWKRQVALEKTGC